MYSLLALSTFRMLATITIIYIQNFSTFQTETQSLLNNNSSSPLSPGNFYSTFCLWTLCEFWGPHGSGIIQCLSFHGWLTSLRIMFSRFIMLQHISDLHSFLWLKKIPLCVCVCVYKMYVKFIHLLMDVWVVSTFWLLWIMLLWTCYVSICLSPCFLFFWICG